MRVMIPPSRAPPKKPRELASAGPICASCTKHVQGSLSSQGPGAHHVKIRRTVKSVKRTDLSVWLTQMKIPPGLVNEITTDPVKMILVFLALYTSVTFIEKAVDYYFPSPCICDHVHEPTTNLDDQRPETKLEDELFEEATP